MKNEVKRLMKKGCRTAEGALTRCCCSGRKNAREKAVDDIQTHLPLPPLPPPLHCVGRWRSDRADAAADQHAELAEIQVRRAAASG